jgi:hypothetical protein
MIDWGRVLVGQLEFYWDVHLRPRLEGLTDAEYVWEPVGGCWPLRRQKSGTWVLDGKWPEPSPPPVTTIAWRLVHVAVGCFATRAIAFFDGSAPEDATMFDARLAPVDLPGDRRRGDRLSRTQLPAMARWHRLTRHRRPDRAARTQGGHSPTIQWPS